MPPRYYTLTVGCALTPFLSLPAMLCTPLFDKPGSVTQFHTGAGSVAGSGNDCQPISSRDHSMGSFQSCNTPIDRAPSQSVIAYAQVGPAGCYPAAVDVTACACKSEALCLLAFIQHGGALHSRKNVMQEFLRSCNSSGAELPAAVDQSQCTQAQGPVFNSR